MSQRWFTKFYGNEVTKEEWLQFRQKLQEYKKRKQEWKELNINNEHHPNDHKEEVSENHDDNGDLHHEYIVATLKFPIWKLTGLDPMKNISSSVLLHFHGKATEDPDELLSDLDILCQSYDYTSSEKKLKLFPTNLDNFLCWFMRLGGETIATWEQMK